MATIIKLKRGTTTPTTGDITSGEVAVDTSAQKLYINDGGTVKEIVAMYFPERNAIVGQLKMNTKTSKKLYFGELVRIEKKNKGD